VSDECYNKNKQVSKILSIAINEQNSD
jgi:hypothetical protein